jgi:hypothetical protein
MPLASTPLLPNFIVQAVAEAVSDYATNTTSALAVDENVLLQLQKLKHACDQLRWVLLFDEGEVVYG